MDDETGSNVYLYYFYIKEYMSKWVNLISNIIGITHLGSEASILPLNIY